MVSLHGWRLRGAPLPLRFEPVGAGNRFRSVLPADLEPGEIISLSLWLPRLEGPAKAFRLQWGGREVDAHETFVRGMRVHYLTPRIEVPPAVRELVVRFDAAPSTDRLPEGELCRWRAPEPAAGRR